MGIGVSVFLLAVGAVMAFALDIDSSRGVNLETIGVILMVVGAIGLLAFMTVLSSWSGRGRGDVVIEDRRPY